MKVLIACERFGVIRDAFIRAGHDAWSCDLVDTLAPGPHITGDALLILDHGWDLMIAHPDCTYLTCSAEWAYGDGPYHQRVKHGTLVGSARRSAREDALRFVEALAAAPIERIAIENPAIGAINKRVNLRQYGFRTNFPTQIIQPYQFGHDASKATGLALKNLPDLSSTAYVKPRLVCKTCKNVFEHGLHECPSCGSQQYLPRWANQTDSGQNRLSPGDGRAMERARTYDGWADAMVSQWGGRFTSSSDNDNSAFSLTEGGAS